MATSRLAATLLEFTSNGTDINARITASDDTLTFFGTGGVNNEIQLSNVKDPSAAQDAATKNYVDSLVVSGVTWKNAARLATDGNETGTFTYDGTSVISVTVNNSIDGVTPVNGDRVLIKDSSIITSNPTLALGIYVVSAVSTTVSCTLTRATDAANGDSANGAAIFIYAGDAVTPVNNDTTWVVTNDAAVNWGGAVTWTQMSAAPVLGPLTQDHMFVGDTNGDAKDGGANILYDYSTRATAPVFSIGADTSAANTAATFNLGTETTGAAVAATINMGDGTGASTIDAQGTGLFTIQTAGAFTSTAAVGSAVNLFNTTTTGNISTGGALTTGTITLGNATASGTVSINNAGTMNIGLNTTSLNFGNNTTGTTTTIDGEEINIGGTASDAINVTAGAGGTGAGGTINITGGDATAVTQSGGQVLISSGEGNTSGAGGAISIDAGDGGSTDGSIGGAITLFSGSSTATNGDGGDITITAGQATGTGTDGALVFNVGGVAANWPVADAAGTNYILTKSSATAQMTWTSPGAATMTPLATNQLYIGDGSNAAAASGDQITMTGVLSGTTPTFNIAGTGNATSSTTATINLGTTSGNATVTSSINIGKGAVASSINFDSTGSNLITSDGALSLNSTSADLTLQAATSGNVVIDTATNDWTFNATTLSSDGAATISSTSADLTLQAATSGNVVIDTATNDWTFNATTLSSAGAATVSSTSADMTISTTTSGTVVIDSADQSGTPAEATGSILDIETQTFTDSATAGSGTATFMSFSTIAAPTLAATNTSVTTTDAATLYLAGGPAAGTNETITNSWAIYVDDATGAGNVFVGGDLTVGGAFTQPLATDQFFVGNGSGIAEASGADFTLVASGADNTLNIGTSTTNENGTIVLGDATGTGSSTITMNGDTVTLNSDSDGAATVGLFAANTTGNISMGSGLTSGTMTIGNTTATGKVTINNAGVFELGANATDVDLGSSNATTTNVDGVSVDIGSTATTSLDLLATGVSGAIAITAGDVTGSGTVSISTTTATTATVSGGEIDLTAGDGATTGAGGAIDINAGSGGSTDGSVGGAVTINAGTSTATNGNGGSVTLTAGSKTGTGTDGNIVFNVPLASGTSVTENAVLFQAAGTTYASFRGNGEMYAVAFNATSDARYKTNIKSLNDPLSQINKLEGYSYNWKEDFSSDKTLQYGVLAQQLEEVGLNHLVSGSEDSKAVNYMGLIPLLIGAVKELSAKVEHQDKALRNVEKIEKSRDRKGW